MCCWGISNSVCGWGFGGCGGVSVGGGEHFSVWVFGGGVGGSQGGGAGGHVTSPTYNTDLKMIHKSPWYLKGCVLRNNINPLLE